jgi:hypothetical protein
MNLANFHFVKSGQLLIEQTDFVLQDKTKWYGHQVALHLYYLMEQLTVIRNFDPELQE